MKYKMMLLAGFIFLFMVIPVALFADEDKHARSVEDVLKDIRQEQNVTQNRDIDTDKVNDDLLEELGDAVMSLRFPDERQHEWMDNMMGGEGSESLRAAHIRMGYNYLAGGFGGGGGMMMGTGWGMPMMGGPGYGWGMHSFMGGPWGIVFLVIVVVAIGAVVTFVVTRNKQNVTADNPMAIIKTRLAKGEITKAEYDKLKDDVN